MRAVRVSSGASGRVVDGSQSDVARLIGISTHGAKFECAAQLAPDREITFQAHAMEPLLGEIIWSDADGEHLQIYGLQFRQPLTLRQLAEGSLRLQPFSAPVHGGFDGAPSREQAA